MKNISKLIILSVGVFLLSWSSVQAATILFPSGGGTGWGFPGGVSSGYVLIGNGLGRMATDTAAYVDTSNHRFGIGSTTPGALLAVMGRDQQTYPGNNLFTIGSSTASATTTLFSINNIGQVLHTNGSVTAPSISFAAFPTYGIYFNSSTGMVFTHAGTDAIGIRSNLLTLPSTSSIGWTNGGIGGTFDTNFSRLGVNKVSVGNGTVLDTSGTLIAGSIGVGTTTPWGQLSILSTTDSKPSFAIQTSNTVPATDTVNIKDSNLNTLFALRYLSGVGASALNMYVSGNAAIGGTALNSNILLIASSNTTDPTAAQVGANFSRTLVLTATNNKDVTGGVFNASLGNNNFAYTGTAYGGIFEVQNGNNNTSSSNVGGQFLDYYQGTTGTLTNGYSGQFVIQNLFGGGTITNAYGAYVGKGFNNGQILNEYGVYVDTLPVASTTFGFYENSVANNYFKGNLGLGTTTPTAAFVSIAASSTVATTAYTGVVSIIGGLENGVTKLFQEIDQWGHLITSGDTPSVSGGTSTVAGNDNNGAITVTGTLLTSVTLTFAHAWPTAPDCTMADSSTGITGAITSISTTQVVIGFSAGINSGTVWFMCAGHQ